MKTVYIKTLLYRLLSVKHHSQSSPSINYPQRHNKPQTGRAVRQGHALQPALSTLWGLQRSMAWALE